MPTTEQLVKKITVGSDSRFIGAKYDYKGEEIDVSKLATKDELDNLDASINTKFTQKDEIIKIINEQLEKGDESIDLEKNEGVVRKMTFIDKLKSNDTLDLGNNNHFIIYFVKTSMQNEQLDLPFYLNSNSSITLKKDQYKDGAKIEVLNNTAIATDIYGNPTVVIAPEAVLSRIAFGEVPEGAAISLIVFEEPLTAVGFSETEQEPKGSE